MIESTLSVDLGCGPNPRNFFGATECIGIDIISSSSEARVLRADLAIEKIPLPSSIADYVTAFDFIEHIPRVLYGDSRRNAFVELMNEVHRVLRPGGLFFSFTPAYPNLAAFSDPTHVNTITDETFPQYFCTPRNLASVYGFIGAFEFISQEWQHPHLKTLLRKPK